MRPPMLLLLLPGTPRPWTRHDIGPTPPTMRSVSFSRPPHTHAVALLGGAPDEGVRSAAWPCGAAILRTSRPRPQHRGPEGACVLIRESLA